MSNSTPRSRLGPYELVGPLGAGGMGEVYRARDTRLDRAVAIKRLPPSLAADPDARARFEREARAIAALNHPHICTLYDIGRDEESDYLVMELVEGETLARRLQRGPLPVEQALAIAGQIAEALDRAHRQGIVHRDLKPSNVMIVGGGAAATPQVKLLDFGLARLVGRPAVSFAAPPEVTRASAAPLTGAGAILGTLNYMSPEQVEGKDADHRADIFALGCVVYEMLTGTRAFGGETPASTMAAILERQPAPVSTVRPVAPGWLDLVLRRALAKDPEDRWQSAGDIAICLRDMPAAVRVSPATTPSRTGRAAMAAVALAAVAIGAGAAWLWTSRSVTAPSRTLARLTLPIAPATALSKTLVLGLLAIAPAGDAVAYVGTAGGERAIFLRRLDQPAAAALPNTSTAGGPFFSPDGRWLAYQQAGASASLVKMLLATGATTIICPLAGQIRGAVWGRDGTIVFGSDRGPLYRVAADGGIPMPLAPIREGELAHRWPALLPDGDHVLFTAGAPIASRWDDVPIEVQNLRTGARQSLGVRGMQPQFVPPGRLVFARDPQLMAMPFDLRTMTATGAATPIFQDLSNVWSAGSAHYAVADSGTLVFVSESLGTDGLSMTRVPLGAAAAGTLPIPLGLYADPVVSPNGRLVAVEDYSEADDIFVIDLATGAPLRLTFSEHEDETPVWSPDSAWVAYAADRAEGRQILRRRADGGGGEEVLWTGKDHLHIDDWTPDGRYLLTSGVGEAGIGLLDLQASPASIRSFMPAQTAVSMARLSADGRWIAYASGESGGGGIYVQDFPDLTARWQVSPSGVNPMWAPDGRALFYRSGATLYRAPVQPTGSALSFGPATEVFTALAGVKGNHRSFAVLADGDALVLENKAADQGVYLNVFLNWAATLGGSVR